jgi:hypothetical protein
MQEQLRAIAQESLARIERLEMSEYAGPTGLIAGEEGLYVPANRLNADADFLHLLALPDELEELDSEELVDQSMSFYAIAVGADLGDRTFFVRKRLRTLQASHLLIARIATTLRPIQSNVLYLDRTIDFILRPEGAVVFEARAFEMYVQDPEDIAKQMDADLETIQEALPIESDTLEALKQKGRAGALVRRRIRAIAESEYLEGVTMATLRDAFRRLGKDPSKYIHRNELRFSMEQAPFVLKVLDESAWVGQFSNRLLSTNAKRVET